MSIYYYLFVCFVCGGRGGGADGGKSVRVTEPRVQGSMFWRP